MISGGPRGCHRQNVRQSCSISWIVPTAPPETPAASPLRRPLTLLTTSEPPPITAPCAAPSPAPARQPGTAPTPPAADPTAPPTIQPVPAPMPAPFTADFATSIASSITLSPVGSAPLAPTANAQRPSHTPFIPPVWTQPPPAERVRPQTRRQPTTQDRAVSRAIASNSHAMFPKRHRRAHLCLGLPAPGGCRAAR